MAPGRRGYGMWPVDPEGQTALMFCEGEHAGSARGPKLQLGHVREAEIAPLARIWDMGYGAWEARIWDMGYGRWIHRVRRHSYSAKEGHVGAARGPWLQLGRVREAEIAPLARRWDMGDGAWKARRWDKAGGSRG